MSDYILGESNAETARLTEQAARDALEPRLVWAGLKPGMAALDAGCGPGETTRSIAHIVGPKGQVRGFDLSPARIEAAKARPAGTNDAPTSFEVADIHAPPVPEGEADFLLCQYVLEYLPKPERAVEALVRTLKPGGHILLIDADGIGLVNWPVPPLVEEGLPKLVAMLARTGFDPYVGRKLYSMAVGAGLTNVAVSIYPAMMAAGKASAADEAGWRQRFEALRPLGVAAFGAAEQWDAFVTGYLAMMTDPASFKFALGIAVRGTRP